MYIVYDTENDDISAGVYDSIDDITSALGLKRNHVHSIVSKKSKYKRRYRIEYIKDEPDDDEDEL